MLIYSKLKGAVILDKILGGKAMLAATPNESFNVIVTGIPGVVVALIVAIAFGIIAWKLPEKSS
jgi:hypothetical protein